MPLICLDIMQALEKIAAPYYSEEWDNIGLQIGDPQSLVNKVLVTLDVNLGVVEEAIENDVDLIVCHHTPMFQPLSTIRWDNPQGKLIQRLIEKKINLYCAHTNLDSCPGGVNDVLAQALHLKDLEVLSPSWQEDLFKIVVFVPHGYENQIRDSLSEGGAGCIGNYSHCTFQIDGEGTFLPLAGTNPYIGTHGKLEKVHEYRLETIVSKENLHNTISKMLAAHPYEEVAYDVYPLIRKGKVSGLGRIGNLEEKITLGQLIENVKKVLNINNLRYVGEENSLVKKIALCGGSGASLINLAMEKGAQVYLTGDIKYHEAQEAESRGLAIVDAGHYATEVPVIKEVVNYLQNSFANKLKVFSSQINTDPFKFI